MKKKYYAALLAVVVIAFTDIMFIRVKRRMPLYLIWQWLT